MKRVGKILSLVTLMVVLSTSLCFAGTLNLTETYPEDGATGAAIENLGVKLYFDTAFTEEKIGDANADAFKLFGPDGEKLPIRVLYPPKEDGVVLVLLDTTYDGDGDGAADYMNAVPNSEYKLVISGNLTDDEGNLLGADKAIRFTTINQTLSMAVNMIMMTGMMVGMVVVSSKQAKKQVEEEQRRMKEEAFNPYKEAKRTGKSVEEVMAIHEKEEAKRAAKEARKAAKAGDDDDYEWIDENTYRVARKRPISEGGSAYITGRKAIAEAKKAEEAARKAAKAAQKHNVKKGKGKKKK